MKLLLATVFAALTCAAPLGTAAAAEDVVIVYDASGSMWGQIDGVNKVVIAREVMADLVQSWPTATNLGLVAYGHRRAGDCRDIETLIEPGPLDRDAFIATVNAIDPKGKTPISASLQHAAELLSWRDSRATVVLVSDGLETCNADPCAVARELSAKGVNFTAHVVGFDLDEASNKSLACIAENTGGLFVPASNAAELRRALGQVRDAVVEQAQPEATPAAEPAVAEEAAVEVGAPEQVIRGTRFAVSWSASLAPSDYVTIVPIDAKDGTRQNHLRVKDQHNGELQAPADPGSYEVRYVSDDNKHTLGRKVIEVVDAEVGVSAPAQVQQGVRFEVTWTPPVAGSDIITIVAADAKEGTHKNHIRTGDKRSGTLTAPSEPGLYEVRYVLDEGRRTLATAAVEVTVAEVTLGGPDVVRASAPLTATWSHNINSADYVTVVPAGAKQGTRKNHIRVGDKQQGTLKAPDETGMYELRYVLEEGRSTLASHPLEVVAADAALDFGAGLQVPAQAAAGSSIRVSWSGDGGGDHRIALARADQADFSWIEAHKVGTDKSQALQMPDEPGHYEIRYLDVGARQVLGRAIVEVK